MKILLSCPNCGDTNWIRINEDGAYECGACGETAFPEDMCAIVDDNDYADKYGKIKALSLTDHVEFGRPIFKDCGQIKNEVLEILESA